MHLTHKEPFAKGKRGIVFTAKLGRKTVLVKEHNPSSVVNTIEHEANILRIVNARGIGPVFIAFEQGMLVREFIDGEEILPWIEHAPRAAIMRVIIALVEQCRALDEMGMNKRELNHPEKHILVRKGLPVQIDFERAVRSVRPKNITQVCQWICGLRVTPLLASKRIHIDRVTLLAAAAAYKRTYSTEAFCDILTCIRGGGV